MSDCADMSTQVFEAPKPQLAEKPKGELEMKTETFRASTIDVMFYGKEGFRQFGHSFTGRIEHHQREDFDYDRIVVDDGREQLRATIEKWRKDGFIILGNEVRLWSDFGSATITKESEIVQEITYKYGRKEIGE